MSIMDILSLTFIILAILSIFLWGLWLLKKTPLAAKHVFRSIKNKLFNFIGLIIFFGLTTSIVTGSVVSSDRSVVGINNLWTEGNFGTQRMPINGLDINTTRIKAFHKKHDETKPIWDWEGNEYNDLIIDIESSDSTFNFNNMPGISQIWWNMNYDTVPSFEQWAIGTPWIDLDGNTHQPINSSQDKIHTTFLFDQTNIYSGDNRYSMLVYILDMFHYFGTEDVGLTSSDWEKVDSEKLYNHPKQFGYNIIKQIDGYFISNNAIGVKTGKIVELPNSDSINQKKVVHQQSSNEYRINQIVLSKKSENLQLTSDGYPNLQSGQIILHDNFIKSHSQLKVGSKISVGESIANVKEFEIVGTGYIPSKTNEINFWTSTGDWSENPSGFVNEEDFFDIWNSNPWNQTNPGWFDLNNALSMWVYMGNAQVYQSIEDKNHKALDIYEDNVLWKKVGTDDKKYYHFAYELDSNVNYWVNQLLTSDTTNLLPHPNLQPRTNWGDDPYGFSFCQLAVNNWQDLSFLTIDSQIKLQVLFNTQLIFIFIGINTIIIFIFVKRRIDEHKQNIATFKALGYRSHKVAGSYAVYPMMISVLGGILGILLSLGFQQWWLQFATGTFAVDFGIPTLSLFSFAITVLFPLLSVTFFVTLITYINLKTNSIAGLTGESTHKANFLVRGWGNISHGMNNFLLSYKIKNILRQFGKSAFIFSSIIGTTIIFTLGSAFVNWQDYATTETMKSYGNVKNAKWFYDTNNGNTSPEKFMTISELDNEIETGVRTEYTFAHNPEASWGNVLVLLASPLNGNDAKEDNAILVWQENIGNYLATETVDNRYIKNGLSINPDFGVDNLVKVIVDLATALGNGGAWGPLKLGEYVAAIGNDPIAGLILIITDFAAWANGDVGCSLSCGSGSNNVNSSLPPLAKDFFTTIGEIFDTKGAISPTLHTIILNSQLPIAKKDIVVTVASDPTNTYEINIEQAAAMMTQYLIAQVLGVLDNNFVEWILDVVMAILLGNDIPSFRGSFKEGYITPGIVGYDKTKEFVAAFSIGPDRGLDGNTPNITFDQSNKEIYEASLIGRPETMIETFEYYSKAWNGNMNVDNNNEAYIPTAFMSSQIYHRAAVEKNPIKFSNEAIDDFNNVRTMASKTALYDAIYLDWTKEAHYDPITETMVWSNPNANPNPTWIHTLDTTHERGVNEFWKNIDGAGNSYFAEFKIVDHSSKPQGTGIWQVPIVKYADQDLPLTDIREVKQFGANFKMVGVFESYVYLGRVYYSGEHGLYDFTKNSVGNFIGKPTTSSGYEMLYFEKYQSLWSSHFNYLDDVDRKLLLPNTSSFQPYETFGTPIPVPFPLELVGGMVETQYDPFSKIVVFFSIISMVLSAFIIIVTTKEVVDSTSDEMSVLKALGYKNSTATGLVLDGQGILFALSFAIALPLTIIILDFVSVELIKITALYFALSAQNLAFLAVFLGLCVIFVVIYLLGYYTFKKVSPLKTTK